MAVGNWFGTWLLYWVTDLVRGLWFVALGTWLGSCPTVGTPYGILNAKNIYFKHSFGALCTMVTNTTYSLVLGPNIGLYEHVPIRIRVVFIVTIYPLKKWGKTELYSLSYGISKILGKIPVFLLCPVITHWDLIRYIFSVIKSFPTLTPYHYPRYQSHYSFSCLVYYTLQCICYSYCYKPVILFQSVIEQKFLIRIIPNFNTP